jgi:hypothetical protein
VISDLLSARVTTNCASQNNFNRELLKRISHCRQRGQFESCRSLCSRGIEVLTSLKENGGSTRSNSTLIYLNCMLIGLTFYVGLELSDKKDAIVLDSVCAIRCCPHSHFARECLAHVHGFDGCGSDKGSWRRRWRK